MDSHTLRQVFFDFFEEKKHQILPAAPVVLPNDPTLLFVNAGMNQFKEIFLDKAKSKVTRIANAQYCVRVSGKHNDLEDVGFDSTHLTSFEMLGNWSFNDYYKKEAIVWAWEWLTQGLKIPREKLFATVHHSDQESKDIWLSQTNIKKEQVLVFGDKDNFWEMGQVGPCGPCTEIHVDLGDLEKDPVDFTDPIKGVNGENSRFVELWNLVFIQYNRQKDQSLVPLKHQYVDTGAGFERLLSYLQGKTSVYETDTLKPIIEKVEEITRKTYTDSQEGAPFRILADHARTLTMAIADNVLPSNEGRGYVLRRLLRRASKYARSLSVEEPIIFKLVPVMAEIMRSYYPHIAKRTAFIQEVIKSEEERFLKTLEAGLIYFEKCAKGAEINGKDAFKLYDTYGFPLDLTQVLAKENHQDVDLDGFEKEMEKQKARSRQATKAHQAVFKEKPGGGEARFVKNEEERLKMSRHHTATHLLQAALRDVLGTHVNQAGSLVDLESLRFDFTHPKALTEDQIKKVESLINQKIQQHHEVIIEQMPLEEAKKKGAMSLFGEKYPEQVRVVQIDNFSMELCGGNHVENTREIEQVAMIQETAVAAGVRRIEAKAGLDNINKHINQKKEILYQEFIKKVKKYQSLDQNQGPISEPRGKDESLESLKEKVDQLSALIKKAEKKKRKKEEGKIKENRGELKESMMTLSNYKVLIKHVEDANIPKLRLVADQIMTLDEKIMTILAGSQKNIAYFLVKMSSPVVGLGLDASKIIKQLTTIAGGRGGGREDKAEAGGADPNLIEKALQEVVKTLG